MLRTPQHLRCIGQIVAEHDRVDVWFTRAPINDQCPGGQAQADLLREAYRLAGIDPATVDYVEAHGTGTVLGDAIEADALAEVTGPGRPADRPLLVGSLKSNIGHTEPAAGAAGLVKALAVLKHRQVPPTLHHQRTNPRITEAGHLIRVADDIIDLPAQPVVGVSSFGFGGTNAHLVLTRDTAIPAPALLPDADEWAMLPLSGTSEAGLAGRAAQFVGELATPEVDLQAVCSTAAQRRTHHSQRLVVWGDRLTMVEALANADHPQRCSGATRLSPGGRTVFAFSGQGGRWWPLAEDLTHLPVAAERLAEADAILRDLHGFSLLDVSRMALDDERPTDPRVGQPAITAIQIALAEQWRAWGITPDVVLGHSLGEVAAMQVAGAFDLATAIRVAAARGAVIAQLAPPGAMALLACPAERVEGELAGIGGDRLWIASVNSPEETIVSGAQRQGRPTPPAGA